MARTNDWDQIKPDNPCEAGTSMAWMNFSGKMYWLHSDQHWKFAEDELEKMGMTFNDHIGGPNRTLILMGDWIKISNYRDFAMKEYDEERHFDLEAQEEWDSYADQLRKLAEYIVNCVIYNNDDPSKPIINIVYMSWGGPEEDERITMTPHDVVYKFGGPKYGKKLLDKMYDGLERKMNPRKGTSVLGALILGGIIGHSMKK